jgi:acetyltransferase-like isoleucine patch superfamily enzyme
MTSPEDKPKTLSLPYFLDETTSYHISNTASIGILTKLYGGGLIVIGNNTHVGNGSFIHAAPEHKVIIGSHCSISHYCYITTDKRKIETKEDDADVIIKDGAWIGFNSFIKGGITIGKGAIVGACSVVLRDVPDGAVVGGNPARPLKR